MLTKPQPTNLKQINKIITVNNAEIDNIKLPKIIRDFKPSYIYGKIKIHKPGNPLRPIISQIPTSAYYIAKTINNIIQLDI